MRMSTSTSSLPSSARRAIEVPANCFEIDAIYMEDRIGNDRNPVFQIGHAVAAGVDDLTVPLDSEGCPGGVGPIPFLKQAVDPVGKVGPQIGDADLLREHRFWCSHLAETPDRSVRHPVHHMRESRGKRQGDDEDGRR